MAESYLTSGGGAKAVMGVLLYLLLLLDAFTATRIRRGGVLPDLWRRRKGRHGRPTLSSAATGCLHSHWRPPCRSPT